MKSLIATVKARLASMPSGALGILVGLLTLGVSNYVFLVVAGQVLGDAKYAPLGTLWIILFLLSPGFLYPIEQEVARAVAARRVHGDGIAPVVRKAAVLAGVIMLALVAVVLATAPEIQSSFFDHQPLVLLGLLIGLVSYAVSYVTRGVYAGSTKLNPYGATIAYEGGWRVIGALLLLAVGVKSAGPYGLLVGITPLIAVVLTAPKQRNLVDPGSHASWSELSSSLGSLVSAAVLSQVLLNAAPLFVKYESNASQQDLAGAFLKAVVITRIPMFLFQAVQAVMLPRLTSLATQQKWQQFTKRLMEACLVVSAVGIVGILGSLVFGNFALSMFGSEYPLPSVDLALLAAGCAVFLVATMVSQALIAVSAQGGTVIGWGIGVVIFALGLMLPGSLERRAEIAMILGSVASLLVMVALVKRRLARHGDIKQSSNDEVIDLALESETYA